MIVCEGYIPRPFRLNLTHFAAIIRHGEGGGAAETLVESDYAAS